LPPPTAPAGKPPSSRPSSVPLVLGIVAAVVVALGIVAYVLFRPNPNPNPNPVPPTPAPSPLNPVAALIGTWTNPAAHQNNGLAKLEISSTGAQQVSIHAWGLCSQSVCDWGTQTATFDGQQTQATWKIEPNRAGAVERTAIVTAKPVTGGLRVTIANTFGDNRPPNQAQFTFVKAQ